MNDDPTPIDDPAAAMFIDVLRTYIDGVIDLANTLGAGGDPVVVADQLRTISANIQSRRFGDADLVRVRALELVQRYGTQADAGLAVGINPKSMSHLIMRARGKRPTDQTLRAIGIRRIVLYELLDLPDNAETARRLQNARRESGQESRPILPAAPPALSIEQRMRLERHLTSTRGRPKKG